MMTADQNSKAAQVGLVTDAKAKEVATAAYQKTAIEVQYERAALLARGQKAI